MADATSVPALPKDATAESEGSQDGQYYKVHWFRSTIFQVIVVFFCAPGMYNALSNLGAGGLATPWYANATSAAGYGPSPPLSPFGSADTVQYAGSLYLNSKNGTQWFLMLGSILSGMTDGLMYAVEGPIITSYPESASRGKMLGLWVFMRSAAPVVGGAIIFGLNIKEDSAGAVSLVTYLVLIGIMCAGPFISLLISSPDKVQRRDGKPIHFRKTGWMQTFKEWFQVVSSPNILLLCPLFFTSWFYGSYIGTLQTQFYNVRSRSLCAFVINFADIMGGFGIGWFLDQQRLSIKQRARWAFIGLMAFNLLLWLWTAIVTKQLIDHQPTIDWTDSSWFGKTFTLFFLFDMATMATQTTLYWILSQMSDDFITLSYMTGTLRGIECAGQAVAYGIKSSDTTDWLSIGLNIGLIVFSLPFAWIVIRKIGVETFEVVRLADESAPQEKPATPTGEKAEYVA
uniref:Major facilitator superfamily (MFS) profile domain-containing protein n=1 Tax=Schizophyllum commune (strain H4-8 / FGSC 9210) TaxID=578458 RepID=D8PVA7_SCHCM